MSKQTRGRFQSHVALPKNTQVTSLLDAMKDGKEYASLVSLAPQRMDLGNELRRSIAEIESAKNIDTYINFN